MSASSPAVAAIESYHDKIPVRNALDFGEPPGAIGPQSAPVPGAAVACILGQPCDAAPAAPALGADPTGSVAPTAAIGGDAPDAPAATPALDATGPPLERDVWTSEELDLSDAEAPRPGRAVAGMAAWLLAVAAAVPVYVVAPPLLW